MSCGWVLFPTKLDAVAASGAMRGDLLSRLGGTPVEISLWSLLRMLGLSDPKDSKLPGSIWLMIDVSNMLLTIVRFNSTTHFTEMGSWPCGSKLFLLQIGERDGEAHAKSILHHRPG